MLQAAARYFQDRFDSKLVRLKDRPRTLYVGHHRSFDSKLVRLKVLILRNMRFEFLQFRFQTGSIKRRNTREHFPRGCKKRFDSKLVRLKVHTYLNNLNNKILVSIPNWFD